MTRSLLLHVCLTGAPDPDLAARLAPWGWEVHQPEASGTKLALDGPFTTLVQGDAAAWWAWCAQAPQATGPRCWVGDAPPPQDWARALAAGLDAWAPAAVWPAPGTAPQAAAPLAALLAQAQARWAAGQAQHQQLQRLQTQLDERKWVDRAKGVLMSARGDLDEAEAFRLLRGAAMHANLRLGEMSRGVAESAQWAEGLNQAGQLRMLSQRLVRLAAQRLAGVEARAARGAQTQAQARGDSLLQGLLQAPWLAGEAPAQAALAAVAQAWQALQDALALRLGPGMLAAADQAGETLLARAEALVACLEAAAGRRTLSVVNLCGRQRMRVQRLAKLGLLAGLGEATALAQLPALMDEFEDGLRQLEKTPLSSPDIQQDLGAARDEWLRLLRGLRQPEGGSAPAALCGAADRLLALFEQLTSRYEHSLQVIMA
ncbi:type IV pili methyl-accepting chemotaxis transducer N-terminal domain-containing protein [Ideonella livida]|uniref:ANTAR domain-containing protein n=1 Tax=Ideonella livida TaxID=2707176 RepID=A0A7C9PIC3_9BURK|nr:type IV pili methyl-accepting chemotaxis transducer N-terminal domain-containing protein [Ideonella livida]NDY92733.1 ANTAR domain-containing protein [Ideonella livida]